MLSSVRLITRAVVFKRTVPLLHRQSKHVQLRGFSDVSQSKTIFVGQIPYDINEEELKLYFPGSLSVKIIKDKYMGYSRGIWIPKVFRVSKRNKPLVAILHRWWPVERTVRFGYVGYNTHEEAKEAVNRKVEVFGRWLNLDMAPPNNEQRFDESGAPSSTLFVGHLPYNMTESEIMALFPGSTSARIMSDPFTGLSKGFGYVDFTSPEEAREYLKMNGTEFRGQHLNVDLASNRQQSGTEKRGKSEPSSTLFVGNLSYQTTEGLLASAFSGCSSARIVTDQDGKSRGFGYVDFPTVEQAMHVFHNRGGIELDGRITFIDFASNRRKESSQGPVRPISVQKMNNKPTSSLYVANISFDTTSSELAAAFSGCTSARIMTHTDSGRSKGYGFVSFVTVEEAMKIVDSAEEIIVDNHVLSINYAERDDHSKRGTHEPTSTLFVGNLPMTITESSLAAAFSGCTAVRIMIDRKTGRSRGCSFVDYSSIEEAKRVFDNPEDIKLDDKVLFINFSRPQEVVKSEDSHLVGGDMPSDNNLVEEDTTRQLNINDEITDVK